MDSKIWEALRQVASEDVERAKMALPMKAGARVVATNGHVLLAVDEQPDEQQARALGELTFSVDELLAPAPAEIHHFPFAEVKTWALADFTAPRPLRLCKTCNGEGECSCDCCGAEHPCAHCDGRGDFDGWDRLPRRFGFFLGQVLNLNLLARAILFLEADEVRAWLQGSPGDNGRPFVFEAEGWRIVVMPFREDPERIEDLRYFPALPKECRP